MHTFEYTYAQEMLDGLLATLSGLARIPTSLLGIAAYVLTSLALYTMAKRRGIRNPWLSWIPVVNCWVLGSLSDQYRYVVRGEDRSKRKTLILLRIIQFVLELMIGVLAVIMAVQVLMGFSGRALTEARILEMITGPLLGLLGLCVPLLGVSIAYVVIRFMALYDVYKSMDPSNCVLFLVLSILFHITEPFFLFFNREKDLGMPPRRQEPVHAAQDIPQYDPWESKDYL